MLVSPLTLVKLSGVVLLCVLLYLPLTLHDVQVSTTLALQEWMASGNETPPRLVLLPDPAPRPPAYVDAPSVFNLFFSPPDSERQDYHDWNAKALRDLHACIALNNCGPNQLKVALLADSWITNGVVRGFRGGEGVWYSCVSPPMGYPDR
jgi:hypothetical protein